MNKQARLFIFVVWNHEAAPLWERPVGGTELNYLTPPCEELTCCWLIFSSLSPKAPSARLQLRPPGRDEALCRVQEAVVCPQRAAAAAHAARLPAAALHAAREGRCLYAVLTNNLGNLFV